MLLAHMPAIEGSLAHEWGQASGHNYLEGKSPFFCNRGQPEVRMALIRKADGKSLPLAAIEHQDGCYMYTMVATRCESPRTLCNNVRVSLSSSSRARASLLRLVGLARLPKPPLPPHNDGPNPLSPHMMTVPVEKQMN